MTYNYLAKKNENISLDFEGQVQISHSYDKNTRNIYAGNKIRETFCEASYGVKISIFYKSDITLTVLSHQNILRRGAEHHIYEDWKCCFCAPQDIRGMLLEPKGTDVKELYETYIIPFFYNQTYHAFYGVWILGEYSHGDIGIIERYGRERKPDSHFTSITFSFLTEDGKKLLLNGGVFVGGNSCDYKAGIASLRENIKQFLLLNIK